MKKNDLRPQPRWLQMVKAHLGGYFWLPCTGCGKKFGGHEPSGELYQGGGGGILVCLNCAAKAEKQSEAVWKSEGVVEINGRRL